MLHAGFHNFQLRSVESINDDKLGRDVLNDPFLKKHAVSQLAMLSDEEYVNGIERIKLAIQKAETASQLLTFKVRLRMDMITAQLLH
jgi:hypothetical protein